MLVVNREHPAVGSFLTDRTNGMGEARSVQWTPACHDYISTAGLPQASREKSPVCVKSM